MTQQTIDILTISALIFFNLFCFLGIILGLFSLSLMFKVRSILDEIKFKTIDSLETIQGAAFKVGENGIGAMALLSPFIPLLFRRKKGITGILKGLFR